MQLAAQRVKPFASGRQAVVAARPSLARVHHVVQRPVVAKAAEIDLADLGDDVDLTAAPAAASMPIAGENVRLRIRMRGYDINLLAEATEQVRAIAGLTGAQFKGPVMLPTRRKIYCVLRSPHVDKDAREHFEVRTHHR